MSCRYSHLSLGDRITWSKINKPCFNCGERFDLPEVKSTYQGHVTSQRGDFGDIFRADDPFICPVCGHVHYYRFVPCDDDDGDWGVAESLFSIVQAKTELLEISNGSNSSGLLYSRKENN